MMATQEIESANHIISKIDEFPDYFLRQYSNVQNEALLSKKLEYTVRSFNKRLEIAYEISHDFIEFLKQDGIIDPEQPLVGCVQEYEKVCSELYLYFNQIPSDSFHFPHIVERLTKILKDYAGKFQDLRWEVMIHNGLLAPRHTNTFSGGDEFEQILKQRN